MDTTKNGHRFQLITLSYFILASLILGEVLGYLKIELGIVPGIIISQYFMVGLAVVLYVLSTKADIKKTFRLGKLSLIDALICVGIAWTIMPLLSFINVLSQFFVSNQVTEALTATLSYPYIVTLFLTAVTPAVLEELLSRAIILDNYKKHSVLIACLMSGAFFGFIHLNINQFLYAFVMGLIMCYIVMITESIFSSMIIHFIINATGITTLYVTNAMLSVFESNGMLMEDVMAQASEVTTAQLFMSLIMVVIMMAFLTPVAIILINQLIRRNGKVFKGSLKLPAEVFMNAMPKPEEGHGFDEDMAEAIAKKTTIPPVSNQKIITPMYIAVVVLFIVFALLTELMV